MSLLMCSSELGSFSQVQGQCPSLGFGQGGGGQHPTGSRVRVRVTVTVRATVTASNPRPNAPAPCLAACVSSMCSLDRSYLALAQESRRLALEAARRCLVPCSRQLVRFAVRSACRTCTARIDCTVHSTAQHRMCTVPCIDSRLFVTSCSRRALRRSVRRSGGERACVRNTGPPHSRAACATHGHCLGTLGAQGCSPAARGSPASPWEGTLGAGVRAGRRRAWTCITTYLSAFSPALVGSRRPASRRPFQDRI